MPPRGISSLLRLGDEVEVNLYWPHCYPGDTTFQGRVKVLGRDRVLVEAVKRSDDPCVENEFWCSYRQLADPHGERWRAA